MSQMTLGLDTGHGPQSSHDRQVCGLSAGTTVLTLAGAIPVEYLTPGDRIVTRDGARALRDVQVVAAPARMVRVSASAIGVDQPEDDMIITAETRILIRDWRARALKGCDQAVLTAAKLVDGEYIRHEATAGQTMYCLHFDTPVVIYAGGLELALSPVLVEA
ncbi:Hint domain-containing protein [Gemmobacter fulvus]|uniref:Hint domain-containing protein n=1 Tax=Gemmobacter fulvus TaxID=2840474 RepID=A0A975S1Q5_9RHOB|nr:Hint domain-containing protein [Gemmobacter fulvus]MBT9247346.1 Hint domain-containing protein [Gemmobacter fulvus]QWK90173.1 Hint domain-containing protein [Gemmobacter fulvus]